MTSTTPRPTPETDAEVKDFDAPWLYYVNADFARKLERERDKARRSAEVNRLCGDAVVAMCKRQESEIAAMREAIKEVFNSFADEDSAWLLDDLQTAALAKLKPFIKP